MGIVKIEHRGASDKNHDQQRSCTSTVSMLMREDRLLTGKDGADDFDDSDLAEVGYELAMVGDQMCSIPYDIFDLPDLKDVLSLETWNYCLTEEERFHLASYLPHVDDETFVLTLKELLSGCNLFFGSPLEKLLHRLQGGLYSIQVTPVREGLRFLQKQGHHHSLRLYHESMNRKFADMGKALMCCPSSTVVEEKIRIWNNRNSQKPVLLVDLNAFPADEETLNKVDNRVEDFPLSKKTKYMDEGLNLRTPAIDLNSVAVDSKPKGKGVLKVRFIDANATSNHRMQSLLSDCWEPCKRMPKGVLKIKPKGDPFGRPGRPIANPIHTSAFKFHCPLSVFKSHEENAGQNLAYLHWRDHDENKNRSLEQPEPLNDGQGEEFLKMGVESFSDSHNFRRKKKKVSSNRYHNAHELQEGVFPLKSNQRSRMQSDEAIGIGGLHNGVNIWLKSDKQTTVLGVNSSDSDLKESQLQRLTPAHHTISVETARISTVGTFPWYLQQSEPRHKDQFDGGLSTALDSKVVSEVEREIIFPITYKRKKACAKFNTTDSLKQPAMVANLESIVSKSMECNLIGKAKTVKIKINGWNNHNAQYTQGLLNGLQHGSPSTQKN